MGKINISMSPPGNAPETWSTLQPLPNSQRQRKKGGGAVCGTQESDRTPSHALAQDEVVREQSFLAAAAQNIKRLVRFLSQVPRPPLAVTNQI
jgi:hypothetical protein